MMVIFAFHKVEWCNGPKTCAKSWRTLKGGYDTFGAERIGMKEENRAGHVSYISSFPVKSFCNEEGCLKETQFYLIISTIQQVGFGLTNF